MLRIRCFFEPLEASTQSAIKGRAHQERGEISPILFPK
jgi:hypothetical protein